MRGKESYENVTCVGILVLWILVCVCGRLEPSAMRHV
jgi:hypothetical protein